MPDSTEIIVPDGESFPIPDDNAKDGLTPVQAAVAIAGLLFLLCVLIALIFDRSSRLPFYFAVSCYLVFCLHKFVIIVAGLVRRREVVVTPEEIAAYQDWPSYTIMLPVYREASVIGQLVESVGRIDYPHDRLEVLLLLEHEDHETREALAKIALPAHWKKVILPKQTPQTKGKAMQHGLKHATGQYLVIYDAEDVPEPDQLKKAAVAFARLPENVVCLQSKLDYYNQQQNWLTRWFTVEYSGWFEIFLPGIEAIHAPIPLGGTSNHFKVSVLRELKGWDPYNVTEDCDLGTRIFNAGYKTRMLDSATFEEATSRLPSWIRQRSRWAKGFVQTVFVYLKHPIRLLRNMGLVNFLNFFLLVGGNVLVPLINLIFFVPVVVIAWIFPDPMFALTTSIVLTIATMVFLAIAVLGVWRRGYKNLLIPALLSWIYWIFISIGVCRGIIQYISAPSYWEKTEHGFFPTHTKEGQSGSDVGLRPQVQPSKED